MPTSSLVHFFTASLSTVICHLQSGLPLRHTTRPSPCLRVDSALPIRSHWKWVLCTIEPALRLPTLSSYPPPPPGGVGQRIEEAIELIEMEIRHAAAYINAAVVPEVRRESISALRNVANTLRNFADRLDQRSPQQPPPPPPPGQAPRS